MSETSWSTGRVTVCFRALSPRVLLFTMSGHLDATCTPFIEASVAPALAHGERPALFFDTEAVTGYESLYRIRMTDWHKRMKTQTAGQHVFIRSKIVAMGISVANLATGHSLKPYSDRAAFDAALRRALDGNDALEAAR